MISANDIIIYSINSPDNINNEFSFYENQINNSQLKTLMIN